jgi:hypothetical protein
MVRGFFTTGVDTLPYPPPPPPHPPPPPPPLLFVVAVNVAKVVKCFVQITRSLPTFILHSVSVGRASQID